MNEGGFMVIFLILIIMVVSLRKVFLDCLFNELGICLEKKYVFKSMFPGTRYGMQMASPPPGTWY
ncbi:hypothetical protein OIU77_014325 [Salix suchowensis]|uniref:Uncharacterized protein n=1 Tax=Salix suchowensis TaxID=1278906 RepID=A0ABQ8ZYH0_9ROSI|nr:hypothetical protein OIU77_014325 [Salix suchowensis]